MCHFFRTKVIMSETFANIFADFIAQTTSSLAEFTATTSGSAWPAPMPPKPSAIPKPVRKQKNEEEKATKKEESPKEEAPKEKPNLSDVEIDDAILSAIEKAREVNPVSKHFFSSLKKKTGLDRKAIEEKINQLNADGRIKKTVSFGEK